MCQDCKLHHQGGQTHCKTIYIAVKTSWWNIPTALKPYSQSKELLMLKCHSLSTWKNPYCVVGCSVTELRTQHNNFSTQEQAHSDAAFTKILSHSNLRTKCQDHVKIKNKKQPKTKDSSTVDHMDTNTKKTKVVFLFIHPATSCLYRVVCRFDPRSGQSSGIKKIKIKT